MTQKTPDDFRTDFPEFSDPTRFPDARIQMWLTIGYNRLDECVFGDTMFDLAVELFAAHNLYLAFRAARQAAGGAIPGAPASVPTSKSLGPASESFDASVGASGLGSYDQTQYGRTLMDMIPPAIIQL